MARIAFLFILLVISGSADARACVCVCDKNRTVERSIADAYLIVVGKVIEIKAKSTDPDPDDDVVIGNHRLTATGRLQYQRSDDQETDEL